MSVTEIVPNLWLGNVQDSLDSAFISGIDIVINCTKDLKFLDETKKCVRIPIEDNLQDEEITALYKYLPRITDYIHSNLRLGRRVFVHCFAGKQRSASVIVAYIMRYYKLDLNKAIELVKSKRMIIFTPQCNFEKALVQFYMDSCG